MDSFEKLHAFDKSFTSMSLDHFKKHSKHYVLALVSLVILHIIQVQIPKLIMNLSISLERESTITTIGKFIFVALGIIIFRTLSRWYFFYPARIQQKDFRDELLFKISNSVPVLWKKYSTGKLYEIMITDLEELRVFFGFALLQIFNLVIALVILLPAMIKVSPDLLWSLFPLGISFILFSLSLIITTSLSEKGRNEHDILQQMLVEFYDAKKTLNVFCKEQSAGEEFTSQSNKELNYFLKVNIIRSITRPLILLGGGLSLIHAAYLVNHYNFPMSYFVVYSTFIFLLYEPLGYLSWIGIIISETKVSWKRLKDLVKELNYFFDYSKFKTNQDQEYIFDYKTKYWNQEIKFSKNNQYLLIGATASGKSTFLESIHFNALASGLSSVLVPQEPYLFNQTLEQNLFLNHVVTDEKRTLANSLLKLFDLNDLASTEQDLLQLEVGEKGKKLSGGQVKRVHMIRSLLFDYDLILWDDPFSALDVITERKILLELTTNHNFLKDKILLLTTQRQSTLKYFQKAYFCTRDSIVFGSLSDQVFKEKVDLFFKNLKIEIHHG